MTTSQLFLILGWTIIGPKLGSEEGRWTSIALLIISILFWTLERFA